MGFLGMYKNQLQELAQRSCFNLPSYACIREGPDHAPRFRASVNFNGEIYEGPSYCTTLRQAEHAAAEVALNTLSIRGPPKSLAAKVLDETGVYKNLLQETAHRAGLNLPVYTTVRSGPGHLPIFTCTVELAGMSFNGDPARTKKQAEKNAAMAAWSALKQFPNLNSLTQSNKESSDNGEEQEQVIVAPVLSALRPKNETTEQVVQREHQQNIVRKRMMLTHKDKLHSVPLRYQQWRCACMSSELSTYSTLQQPRSHPLQQQQQSHFLSFSPCPTSSKLFPATEICQQHMKAKESSPQLSSPVCLKETPPSIIKPNQSREIHVQVGNRTKLPIQEIPPPLDEQQKDEDEWLNGVKTELPRMNVEKECNPTWANSGFKLVTDFPRPFSLPEAKAPLLPRNFRTNPSPSIFLSRMFCGTDFPAHAMAPAVQIRSVIPVCAAPPIRPPNPSLREKIHKQEGSGSNSQEDIADSAAATMQIFPL